MSGDADVSNTVLLEKSGLEYLERAPQFSRRLVNIAGNDQRLRNTGLTGQSFHKLIKFGQGLNAASHDMRHRFDLLPSKPHRELYHFGETGMGCMRNENPLAGSDNIR